MILGLKIINTNQLGKFDWDRTKADDAVVDVQSNLLVTCSMDRTLVATDMTSGKRVWQTELNTAPLCLDATPDGAYIGMGKQSRHLYVYTLIISQFVAIFIVTVIAVIGMLDGTVQFYSVRTGKMVLGYKAHDSKVRSLQLISTEKMFTGGHDGCVRLWNLAGDNEISTPSAPETEIRPSRVIDFFFEGVLPEPTGSIEPPKIGSGGTQTAVGEGGVEVQAEPQPDGVIRAYRFDNSREASPVVALQADEKKLVTACEDGKSLSQSKYDLICVIYLSRDRWCGFIRYLIFVFHFSMLS